MADDGLPGTVSDGQPAGCAIRVIIGAVLLCPAPFAALLVLDVAEGSRQFDVLDEAALTFLVWLSLPLAYGIGRLRRTAFVPPLAATAAAIASQAATLWIVRPQAPDGSGYDVTFEDAVADLEAALDATFPGRWIPPDDVLRDNRTLCVDQFGRDNGAAYGSAWYELAGAVTPADFAALEMSVASPNWTATAPRFGRAADLGGQNNREFVVTLDYFGDRWTVKLITPCLSLDQS